VSSVDSAVHKSCEAFRIIGHVVSSTSSVQKGVIVSLCPCFTTAISRHHCLLLLYQTCLALPYLQRSSASSIRGLATPWTTDLHCKSVVRCSQKHSCYNSSPCLYVLHSRDLWSSSCSSSW